MQMNFPLQRHNPRGFTLVEIMVSMLIALIVMGGVYRTLSDESIEHDRSEKILDMQNNARVAMGRIVKDVRRAGFLGCGGEPVAIMPIAFGTDATRIGQLTIAAPTVRNMQNYSSILKQLIDFPSMAGPVAGVDYLGEALGFGNNAPAAHDFYQAGTDALTLVYLSDERMVIAPLATAVATDPVTLSSRAYALGDILYITDCEDFSLFQKTNGPDLLTAAHTTTPPSLNTTNNLKFYGREAPARVFKLNTSTYFLNKGSFNLCHNDTDRPIASNIEDLQFEFLFDNSCAGVACVGGDGLLTDESWTTGLGANTSKDVRAVRIWLLAMSDTDFTFTDTNNYNYPSSPYCSAAWNADPLSSCSGTGSPASLAPITSPTNGEHRHRYLASAVVYLRNAGL